MSPVDFLNIFFERLCTHTPTHIQHSNPCTCTHFKNIHSHSHTRTQVSKDCRKIADAVTSLQFLWSGVFEALVIFCVLLGFIDYNALPALGVFMVMLPLQYKLGLWIAHKKAEISKLSSERAQVRLSPLLVCLSPPFSHQGA